MSVELPRIVEYKREFFREKLKNSQKIKGRHHTILWPEHVKISNSRTRAK